MKTTRNMYFLSFVVCYFLFFALLESGYVDRVDVYEKSFRQHFFTAFFSIGSFVFALMTAILFQMEERVYRNEQYKKLHAEAVQASGKAESVCAPLVRVGKLFIFAVLCCLCTSIAQITIGLIPNNWAVAACMSAAITTIGLILYIVYNVKKTMMAWFRILELN